MHRLKKPGGGHEGRRQQQPREEEEGSQPPQEEEEPRLEDVLPSEQDRKAVMGALAASLNIIFAARRREVAVVLPKEAPGGGGESEEGAAKEGEEADANAAINNFSIRGDDDDDDNAGPAGGSAKARQQRERATRRARAFQRELLEVSAELLFLSPDHAAVFLPNLDVQCANDDAARQLLLRPFLESLSSAEASFRCIALLLLRFLLMSGEEKPAGEKQGGGAAGSSSVLDRMTIVGYDARVRYAFKFLAVAVFAHWDTKEHEFMTKSDAAAHATRKFEALEDGVALRLSIIASSMREKGRGKGTSLTGEKKQSTASQTAIRGLKIGAAGVAAGTLFAITGGLAAPAIVGSIAALTGAGSAVTILATVLLLPAATTVFGVGGGTLVASKMNKRTAGLKEFDIVKIAPENSSGGESDSDGRDGTAPELSRTVCIGGWLKDEHDYERPFGVTPRGLTDPHELLCRYCSVYAPHVLPKCDAILKEWKGKESELWDLLRESYGKDPRSLLPFDKGPRYDALLSARENSSVDDMMRALGLSLPAQNVDESPSKKSQEPATVPPTVNLLSDVLAPASEDTKKAQINDKLLRLYKAWDFQAEYGSELYVTKWEKDLLLDLYGSAKEFQKDLAKKAAGEALKKTAMASLMVAVAVPSALLSLSNIIDEKWTLAAERADEAGVLLAQSLLNSQAGHRPVSLVGFSFGARIIVSCLKEIARNQVIWQQQQEEKDGSGVESAEKQSMGASLRKSISSMSTKSKEAVCFIREPASIIEDVILMGCPASVSSSDWLSYREVVGGRLVNCYCSQNDMILALMYRVKNLTKILSPPVGISQVNVPGVENFDVASFVANHGEYCVAVKEILNLVGYGQPMNVRRGSGSD